MYKFSQPFDDDDDYDEYLKDTTQIGGIYIRGSFP